MPLSPSLRGEGIALLPKLLRREPGALEEIFGQGGLEEIAQRAGLTREQASAGMAELLPEVVNHVTPGGEGTDFDQLNQSVDDLQRRMRF